DLEGFGTTAWIRDLLRNPADPRFFGRTKLTAMANWVKRTRASEERKGKGVEFDRELQTIAEWLGSHPPADVSAEGDATPFARGYKLFEDRCGSCHTYKGEGGGSTPAPDLTGYGNADWIRLMVMAPGSTLRYGAQNTMPAFRDLEAVSGD